MASNWISDIYWDERGRPYRVYLMDGPGYRKGERQYVPPVEARYSDDPKLRAWGEGNQQPGQSFLKERGTWDSDTGEWDQGTNWTNLLSAGVGGAIAAPLLLGAVGGGAAGSAGAGGAAGGSGAAGGAGATGAYLAPAAGGSGAAATGGALASSSIPVTAAMHGPNTAAMGSQGASAGIPNTAALGGVAPAAANALTSGGGMGLREMLEAAAKGAPLALSALGGLGGGGNGGNAQGMEEMNRIARITEARMRRADPLHEAAVQMAFGGLPTYGRQGITLPKVPLP